MMVHSATDAETNKNGSADVPKVIAWPKTIYIISRTMSLKKKSPDLPILRVPSGVTTM